MTEKQILDTMKALDLTRQEAIDLIKEDEEIDKMTVKEAQADLSAEQKKAIKSMTKTGEKKPTVYKFDKKRERKVDETKKHIMSCIKVLLEGLKATVQPLTTEAEMHFSYEGAEYTIKLIKHRPPKSAE